ncbi:branched-chain amino acid ABC transporter permease [Desulfobacca acetoxidans]|uniref:ABC-type transporter, integral membrane subunit n=1 Tax=Desulfobacca acetoxidans (strain ATCC 700848 / DSM 11109 / ASRB2) TaxID=880072 RepID=F2NJM7_DESAR|nr:branched-chain amino acid ABC transporter permease [Desulfobacca acetoxidans]AEB09682.1 ABC-type transporter, integral membrane subunit [Desulfobacca acetoxidans DSM 11109]HAY22939.1 branched-chain amino acid ABC transporter permease [Desulfobacterales bacterium]
MTEYFLHLAIISCLYIILALSLNLIIGYCGQVSLGHAAFYGLGAYSSALVAIHWHFPFLLALLTAMIVAALFGLSLGIPTLRLKDDYLAIVTLGFGVIIDLVLLNLDITGGPDGITRIPAPTMFDLNFRLKGWYLMLVVLAVALTLLFIHRLVNSRHGRALKAIRDHEITANVMGINTAAYKIAIFALSAGLAGLAGSLYAHYITFINPESFGLHTSILILTMVVLGGMGSILGSVLGACILTALPEMLRRFADYQDLAYGGLLIVMLIWRPQGLLGGGKLSRKFILPGRKNDN